MVLDATTAAAMTGPASMDAIAPAETWRSYWPEVDRKRRDEAPWSQIAA